MIASMSSTNYLPVLGTMLPVAVCCVSVNDDKGPCAVYEYTSDFSNKRKKGVLFY